MAKDFYDKLAIISTAIKNNWPLLLLLMGSVVTNGVQYVSTENPVVTKNSKPLIKPSVKNVVCSCGKCDELLNKHLKKEH